MEEWDCIGFVCASRYRTRIVGFLLRQSNTPSVISRETNIKISHVSRALNQLEERKIVECLTPNRLKGRIFGLTSRGISIAKKIAQGTRKKN